MPLNLTRFAEVNHFLDAAGEFLVDREAEHNLILGICSTLRGMHRYFGGEPLFALVRDATGSPVAAALRTPPHNLVLSEVDDPAAVALIVDDHAHRDPELPGVLGPVVAARRFSELWLQRTGQGSRPPIGERIFRLSRVVPPSRPATGAWRVARPEDRSLLVDWFLAFGREATPESPAPPDPGRFFDRWIRARVMYLWQDGGTAVSMAGAGGETPNGIRIGPVYTPPELRGRGYASSLTASASQDQLDRGRRFCFLFTDLANPTSNKIYAEIGYEPVTDVLQYSFEVGGGRGEGGTAPA